ncbi:MAG: amidophosphoribosyltransferase [Clostridiales bacterium GWF2_38_85]|nr:MAG: amidophosphoribosyltransferase [Clostridiales bacterium GWF2_38_85]
MLNELHEECGVFGIYSKDINIDVASNTYYALFALQHRGQESCGIVVNDDGVMTSHKDVGLVEHVFTKDTLAQLGQGQIAIGHVRYGTTGTRPRLNAQPIVVNHIKGSMAIAHNGNLTNAFTLREELESNGSIFHTTSDTEVISYVITKERINSSSIEEAVCKAMPKLKGAFSIVLMSPTKLIAVRDPLGFRPLCMGKIGESIIFASETCALDSIGATYIRDIQPGEIVVVDENGVKSITEHCNKSKKALCIFEYIYFARPDSVIDGSSVHTARQRAGAFLSLEHPVQADVVIGVPDSGIDAAIGYAKQSGIPYGLGFIKNRYIGRSFIQPTQLQRETSVRIKLNPIASTLKGKRVIMIDDSIVRGTTSARIVKMIRDAGANEVHMRISSPPFRFPCYFGTDIDSQEHLIACQHTLDEIRDIIDVDSLGYLSLDNLTKICDNGNSGFCTACFSGKYPTEIPTDVKKNKFEQKISNRSTDNE